MGASHPQAARCHDPAGDSRAAGYSMLACLNGELLAIVSVAVLASDGPTGAAVVIQRIDSPAMERAAKLLATRLRLTGFYGLDFI